MRRDPTEIVHALADVLRKTLSGETLRVNDLSVGADVHWTTAQRYLGLIDFIQSAVPRMKLTTVGDIQIVEVLSNPWTDELQRLERLLVQLLEVKAVSPDHAVSTSRFDQNAVEEAREKEFVRVGSNGDIYLTAKGLSKAMPKLSALVRSFDSRFARSQAPHPGLRSVEVAELLAALGDVAEMYDRSVISVGLETPTQPWPRRVPVTVSPRQDGDKKETSVRLAASA